jgi:hypothetical protein
MSRTAPQFPNVYIAFASNDLCAPTSSSGRIGFLIYGNDSISLETHMKLARSSVPDQAKVDQYINQQMYLI